MTTTDPPYKSLTHNLNQSNSKVRNNFKLDVAERASIISQDDEINAVS
jgi:hypothetical protein